MPLGRSSHSISKNIEPFWQRMVTRPRQGEHEDGQKQEHMKGHKNLAA